LVKEALKYVFPGVSPMGYDDGKVEEEKGDRM